ncbi:MAG: DNA-binding protein WhiA, partial [Lachnospiraceae bacterium]|nr:DNA-binding protein WhiA [Lachnospiraceae bacterium]
MAEMSFSSDVKKEILARTPQSRHCKLARLSAIISLDCKISVDMNGNRVIKLQTDNPEEEEAFLALVTDALKTERFSGSPGEWEKVIASCHLKEYEEENGVFYIPDKIVTERLCCKRNFLAAAFVCAGSVTDPEKGYHFELAVGSKKISDMLAEIMMEFDLSAKVIARKGRFVVYVKEAEGISDLLNVCEAHVSLMAFENARIVKEVRNNINRGVNCLAANMKKAADASAKQVKDILFIQEHLGFGALDESLRDVAEKRLQHPEV